MTNAWMEIVDGRQFSPFDEPENLVYSIDPRWIAVALSRACRYAGHTKRFYTVLEHTLIMAKYVEDIGGSSLDVRMALHHDDSEAIMGDLPRPIKVHMPEFKALEKRLDSAFALRFDLYHEFPDWLKEFDTRILVDERRTVMNPSMNVWDTDNLNPLGVRFRPALSWFPWYGVREWLKMHQRHKVS